MNNVKSLEGNSKIYKLDVFKFECKQYTNFYNKTKGKKLK